MSFRPACTLTQSCIFPIWDLSESEPLAVLNSRIKRNNRLDEFVHNCGDVFQTHLFTAETRRSQRAFNFLPIGRPQHNELRLVILPEFPPIEWERWVNGGLFINL